MITRLLIDNYKCLVNFELELGRLTLMMGPNGVGKSAVLDALFALRQLLGLKLPVNHPSVFPTRSLTRWDRRVKQTIELQVELDGDRLTYRLEVEHKPSTEQAKIILERLTDGSTTLFEFRDGQVSLFDDRGKKGAEFQADWGESFLARITARQENHRLTRFVDWVRKLTICGIYPRSLIPESLSEDPVLARDGSNFASWYRHALQERPDLIAGIGGELAEIVDGLKMLRLEKVTDRSRALIAGFKNAVGSFELAIDELSDGQRALIVLYSLLKLNAEEGSTLLLDEPDNYVALAEIQPWLMALRETSGESGAQMVVCSHHPEIVDYLGADCGVLLRRDNGGPVTTRRIADIAIKDSGLKLSELVARGWDE
jgi:predicted ATPase